jgi:predicted DNA-binding transcriptional regulator AlpA
MKKRRKPATGQAAIPVAAYTVKEFCARYRVSPATYYRLQAAGNGPRQHRIGTRVLISVEAAERWQKAAEAGG